MGEGLDPQVRADHDELRALLAAAADAPPEHVRGALHALAIALDAHAGLEVRAFYPELRAAVGDDVVEHLLDEHEGIDETLSALGHARPGSNEFVALLRSLRVDLVDHMTDEEKEVLPLLHGRCSAEQWRTLGERYRDLRTRGGTRDNKVGG